MKFDGLNGRARHVLGLLCLSAAAAHVVPASAQAGGFNVGGKTQGVTTIVKLQNNGGDDKLTLTNTPFTFATKLAAGAKYDVTVASQAANVNCQVQNGSGTIVDHDITDVVITCAQSTAKFSVGGTVSGIYKDPVVLQNNLVSSLTVNANGTFKFPPQSAGSSYKVTVATQPLNKLCTVEKGQGTVTTANITDVSVTCRDSIVGADAGVHSATAKWTGTTDVQSYNLYVSSIRNCDIHNYSQCPDGQMISGATSPRVFSGLRNGQPYFFRLECIYANGTRAVSNDFGARPNAISFNGFVTASAAASDGTIYVGGSSFSAAGVATGAAIPLDTRSGGLRAPDFPIVTGRVEVVTPDGAGGWYVGGLFSHVGKVARTNLAHILSSGQVDSAFAPAAPNDDVTHIVVSNGVVYVAGHFSKFGSVSRSRLAAFNAKGELTSWQPQPNSDITGFATAGNTIYASGHFTAVGGTARASIAALDTSGQVLPWAPAVDGIVGSLAVAGNSVYIGGSFQNVNGLARSHAAAVSSVDGTTLPWNPQPNEGVDQISVSGTTVYLGGAFTSVGGFARNKIASVTSDKGLVNSWNPSIPLEIKTIQASGSVVYVGGSIPAGGGGPPLGGVVAVDSAGGLLPWSAQTDGSVEALSLVGDTIYACGTFGSLAPVLRTNLAAMSPDGTLLPWVPSAPFSRVNKMLVSGNVVYIAGDIHFVNNKSHEGLVAIGTDGVVVDSFNALGIGGVAYDLATFGDMLYVAVSPSDAAPSLAVFYKADVGGVRVNWNPQINSSVTALAVDGSDLYLGGTFTEINGASRQHLARLSMAVDPLRPVLDGWDVRLVGPDVTSLAFGSGQLYIRGFFSALGNATTGPLPRQNFGVATRDGDIPQWPAQSGNISGLVVPGPNIVYSSSRFKDSTTAFQTDLARISPSGVIDQSFRVDVGNVFSWDSHAGNVMNPGAVETVTFANGRIYVGGNFHLVSNDVPDQAPLTGKNFAILNLDGSIVN
jgi:hypothetical protein